MMLMFDDYCERWDVLWGGGMVVFGIVVWGVLFIGVVVIVFLFVMV